MAPSALPPPKKARSTPKTVSDFVVLPLTLPTLPGLPSTLQAAKHYLYIKPHAPSLPTADDERSLFLANIPIDASESNLRALFAEHLGGAMVERVDFDAPVPALPLHKRWKGAQTASVEEGGAELRGKKRKRASDEVLIAEGVVEDADSALPGLWASALNKSGSGAVVVFVDRKSTRGALRAVQGAVKEARTIEWTTSGAGMGVERYKIHTTLTHPTPTTLQSSINAYLTQFTALESLRHKLRKTSRSVPDEDGFVTVTRGGRAGPARIADAERKKAELEERRRNNGVKDDFYRFQNREKRKEAEGELRRRFEEDRRRVEGMRGRGGGRPEV